MLSQSDFPIAEALEILTRHDLEVALLVPTSTGLDKSIMDATADVRDYLRDKGFHDYARQGQGPGDKVVRDAHFVQPTRLVPTQVSLYRPNTKKGDPRIWTGKATRELVVPGNLLALLVVEGELYVVNMSDERIRLSLGDPASPLTRVTTFAARQRVDVSGELLGMLRDVSRKGYIRTLRPGSTGVGMTLETMLGIAANSKQAPDFKGIEIKAKRGGKKENRTTLFSQIPDWRLSPVGSAMGLLDRRGYVRGGRLQLYHELDARQPNSLGLMLEVDEPTDWLKQVHVDAATRLVTHDATWQLQVLRDRLAQKHRETFWVHAHCRGKGEEEDFHYHSVEHTRAPKVRNLEALIEAGVISMDYTLSKISDTRVRDHGYLFKIHASNLGALFPPSERYLLAGPADGGPEGQAHLARPRSARVVAPRGTDVPVALQHDLDLRGGGGRGPVAEDDGNGRQPFLRGLFRAVSKLGKPGGGKRG